MNNWQRAPLAFSDDRTLAAIADEFGTPVFVHDEDSYRAAAQRALDVPGAYGVLVRYAMKANSHRAILKIFDSMALHIDASSPYEVQRAMAAGIAPSRIELTTQQTLSEAELKEVLTPGVLYNATSLLQLERYGQAFGGSGRPLSVRMNPGLGSGHNNRTNTGGRTASFGIWHEYLPQVLALAEQYSLTITHMHTHVGSGSDWEVWQKVAELTLEIVRRMPDVHTLNLGGGYKIDRMNPANSIDLQTVFAHVRGAFESFAERTGRELQLEIEPGTYLAANSCMLLARVCDIVDTGAEGFRFLKLDASMTELLRPMIYGSRHPIRLLGESDTASEDYVVVGTCCESGDIFTPQGTDPERIDTIRLPRAAVGDTVAVMGAGAYGLSMSAKHYNSRPMPAEVMIRADGSHALTSRREEASEIWGRELDV